ncbi:MAG: ABC transporter ATP-binding protein [Anaerolineales bacterium]|nr:ABC transporter ATP-binding protein [Anaerolineales bacterium]
MIEITNLKKSYGSGSKAVHALKGIDLWIENGLFGLLGPNGAGKTTLMRILAGIGTITSGSVHVNGINISSEKGKQEMKKQLGYLPQELGLYPDLTGRQFIDYMAILKGIADTSQRKKRTDDVLDTVSLADAADRKIKEYSGGMKRRVGIAQALVNDPAILIVDEPTAGLDPEERIRFRNMLVDLSEDRIVLLSTHIVADIGQACRDMAVLAEGLICFNGTPAELIHQANGHVWSIITPDGSKPDSGSTIVSVQHLPEGTKYRVVCDQLEGYPDASAEPPSLEDGYLWLMKKLNNHTR